MYGILLGAPTKAGFIGRQDNKMATYLLIVHLIVDIGQFYPVHYRVIVRNVNKHGWKEKQNFKKNSENILKQERLENRGKYPHKQIN